MVKEINQQNLQTVSKQHIKDSPENAGIYVFLDKNKLPIYIGKAKNLKRRLASYLSKDLALKTSAMISDAKYFSFIKVTSEIESLLLEAKLVHSYLPKYNSQLKDDKHPLYIRITKEVFPRVLTARKADLVNSKDHYFGPFPSSTNVKSVLKMLRRIFPYAQHPLGKRKCLYAHIGLCNPCPNEIILIADENEKLEKQKQYFSNIRMIKAFLKGKLGIVKSNLEKKMLAYSKSEKFEQAKELRNKIEQIEYITQPITPVNMFLENPNLLEDIRQKELKELQMILKNYIKVHSLERIECYDIAHLSGTYQTASMVTFINGEADKTFYRHFRIRHKKGSNDIASMLETATRRARYLASWGIPDVIIVDGGKAQVNIFKTVFDEKEIPIIGLAKRFETLIIPGNKTFVEVRVPNGPAKNLVQRIRNEAHRFARHYHHQLLQKSMIPNES